MGGALIASILSAGKDRLEGIRRLVLQPNVGEDIVRRWLLDHGWFLLEESILEEDGKIYEIITAVSEPDAAALNEALYQERELPGGVVLTKDLLLMMGPKLTQWPTDVLITKWESEIDKLNKIRKSVASSHQESSREKEQHLADLSQQIKEVLTCLQKVKP
ncbi:tRNA (adenine(22)-N(1))-methyltransferase [compost metagenome]